MGRKRVSRTRKTVNSNKLKPMKNLIQNSSNEVSKLPSITETLVEAESHINTFNFDSARECCWRVLTLDPQNVKALEMLASILMDEGDIDRAETLYKKCVEISPEEGHEKYFSLGQVNEGVPSLEFYLKGISIIQKLLQESENAAPEKYTSSSLKRALSDAYCSVADLYMTDLCDEEKAEGLCRKAIEDALSTDSDNPEAYQCLASLHIITGEEDAVSLMEKSLSFWLPQHEAIRDNKDADPNNEIVIPEYASRIKTSKLLIELSMFEEAVKVLEGLLDENDQDAFVWFLLGWANYIRGDIYKGNAKFYLKKAKEISKKVGTRDEDLLGQVDSLLTELTGIGSDDEDCGDHDEQVDDSFDDSESEKDEVEMEL